MIARVRAAPLRAVGRPSLGAGGLLRREPLLELLSGPHNAGVTLVSAPAGSGKTTLLRTWARDPGTTGPVAWVSVERGEQDPQRFWLAVIDELGSAVGRGLVQRPSPRPDFDGEAIVGRLLSDLAGLEGPVVLVIDDLHELRSEAALAQLELLLARRPSSLRVVLATRHDPRLGLHRLRLAGELTEIRASELRFSAQEAGDLLTSAGIDLPEADVATLHERTEGWAAGLRLAAMSIAGHPDPERFVVEFSGSERTVADYLLAEVLEAQSDEVRRLLLRTSLLERVNGDLADVLTDGSGSERILQGLEEANAFVVSLDIGRSWFRYHHLFADLLRLELRRSTPDDVARLHSAASGWLAEHGFVVEAVEHSQAAGDWHQAARLLADNLVSLVLDGRGATLQALLAAFPARAREKDADLAWAFTGVELVGGSLDHAAAYLADAERLAATAPPQRRRRLDLQLGLARLTIARRRGDLATVRTEARSLEAALGAQAAADLALGNDLRALALLDLGIAELWSSRLDDARRHLEDSRALAARIDRPWVEVGALGHLAMAAYDRSFTLALEESAGAIAVAERHGLAAELTAAMALVVHGGALLWIGRFQEAEQWLDRAAGVRPGAEPATGVLLQHATGLLRAAQGRPHEAIAAFRAAERLQQLLHGRPFIAVPLRSELLQAQVRLGETAAVRRTLAAMSPGQRRRGEIRAVAGALALAEGDPREALDALAPLVAGRAPALGRLSTVPALLLAAAAHTRLGDARASAAALERALGLAEPEGVVLPFALAPVRELMEGHRGHTAHSVFLSEILDVLAGDAPPPRQGEPLPAQGELSDAELRVVGYLPSNLRATEIAAELSVSPNTIKTHMRHIYAKLGAHNRSEAVDRARALGLLRRSAWR
jgi:LuxR family maltose regulon positive regulatory protein